MKLNLKQRTQQTQAQDINSPVTQPSGPDEKWRINRFRNETGRVYDDLLNIVRIQSVLERLRVMDIDGLQDGFVQQVRQLCANFNPQNAEAVDDQTAIKLDKIAEIMNNLYYSLSSFERSMCQIKCLVENPDKYLATYSNQTTARSRKSKKPVDIEASKQKYLELIRRECRFNGWPAERQQRLLLTCRRVADIYYSAHWDGPQDWPIFATIMVNVINNEGWEAAWNYGRSHLREKMTTIPVGDI